MKGHLIIDCDFVKIRNFSQCLHTPGIKKSSYVSGNVKYKLWCGMVITVTKRMFFSLLLGNDQMVFE